MRGAQGLACLMVPTSPFLSWVKRSRETESALKGREAGKGARASGVQVQMQGRFQEGSLKGKPLGLYMQRAILLLEATV